MGGDGGRAGFEYRDRVAADAGDGRVFDGEGDGRLGVGRRYLQVKSRIAVGLLADGGEGELTRRGQDRKGAVDISQGVVLGRTSAHDNVVGAGRRLGGGFAGHRGEAGEHRFILAVDKTAV